MTDEIGVSVKSAFETKGSIDLNLPFSQITETLCSK